MLSTNFSQLRRFSRTNMQVAAGSTRTAVPADDLQLRGANIVLVMGRTDDHFATHSVYTANMER